MDLAEVGWRAVDWIVLARDGDKCRTLVNAIMNLLVPDNARKLSSGCITDGHWISAQLHS
jgi:hypothetical protein